MTYRERVGASRWFAALLVLLALGLLVGAAVSFVAGGPIVGVAMLLVLAFPAVLWRWFGALEVAVDANAVRASFGPFGQTLAASEIVDVRPERYRWLVFGGWGIRISTRRRRTYSVPFERRSVAITMRDGREWHISTQRPDELAKAVQSIAAGPASGEQASTSKRSS